MYRNESTEGLCVADAATDGILATFPTEFSKLYRFSSYHTENTLRLHYDERPGNTPYKNNRCLL
jgi:hypothetical protein